MKKTILASALALIVSSAQATTVTIAIDKSRSNPLLTDKNFAIGAAHYAQGIIQELKDGDIVRLKSFGARSHTSNLLDQSFTINRRMRAKQIAESMKSYISDLPNHDDQAQSATNIVAMIEFDGNFNCEDNSKVLLLTDGLEASSVVDPQAFYNGTASLPKPDVNLKGCEVIFYGIGAGMPNASVKHLHKSWEKYISETGASYTAIIK